MPVSPQILSLYEAQSRERVGQPLISPTALFSEMNQPGLRSNDHRLWY